MQRQGARGENRDIIIIRWRRSGGAARWRNRARYFSNWWHVLARPPTSGAINFPRNNLPKQMQLTINRRRRFTIGAQLPIIEFQVTHTNNAPLLKRIRVHLGREASRDVPHVKGPRRMPQGGNPGPQKPPTRQPGQDKRGRGAKGSWSGAQRDYNPPA